MSIGGAFWPETSTMFGTYDAAFLGYGCNGSDADGDLVAADPAPFTVSRDSRAGAGPTAPAVNGYTRFYSSGSLEACLLGLDSYLIDLDETVLSSLSLPICDAVTQFYRERFPHLNTTTGKTDMFPAQVIESYWCGNGGAGSSAWGHVGPDGKLQRPYTRSECPTDGVPDVAGLAAILPRLLALPATVLSGYAESVKAWGESLAALPALALEDCHSGGLPHHGGPPNHGCRHCAPNHNSTSCWCNGHMPCAPPTNTTRIVAVAGQYSGIRQHNHENQAAYAVRLCFDVGLMYFWGMMTLLLNSTQQIVDLDASGVAVSSVRGRQAEPGDWCGDVRAPSTPVRSQLVPGHRRRGRARVVN